MNTKELEDLSADDPCFALPRVRPRKDDHPAFADMVRLAKALPMRSFQKDLTFWDRRALQGVDRHHQFAWLLRPTGATLFWQGAKVKIDTLETASDGGAAYWWDGVSLAKMSVEQIQERLGAPSYDKACEILKKHGMVLRSEQVGQFKTRWITDSAWGSIAYRAAADLRDEDFDAELEKTDTKDVYRVIVLIP